MRNIKKTFVFGMVAGVCLLMSNVSYVYAQSNVAIAVPNNESEFGPEFLQALSFAYETGLTKFRTVNDFKPYDKITREQTASMMGQFAYTILNFELNTSKKCDFLDIEKVDPTLYTKVMMSCHTGLFNGTSNGYIYPQKDLSKAEGITVLMRMFKGEKLNEDIEPRYKNYYIEAKEIGLTKEPKVEALERPMTRYETILLLYRFYVKYNLLNIVNGGDKTDGLNMGINMIGDDIVYIDSKSFLDDEIDEIHAQIYGVNYRLVKENLVSQFAGAFTRYGNVFTKIEEDGFIKEEYVGVATFNLVNDVMTDGNIRPIELGDNYYKLYASEIKPFYDIEEVIVKKEDQSKQAEISTTKIDGELQDQDGETIYNPGYIEESSNTFTE